MQITHEEKEHGVISHDNEWQLCGAEAVGPTKRRRVSREILELYDWVSEERSWFSQELAMIEAGYRKIANRTREELRRVRIIQPTLDGSAAGEHYALETVEIDREMSRTGENSQWVEPELVERYWRYCVQYAQCQERLGALHAMEPRQRAVR